MSFLDFMKEFFRIRKFNDEYVLTYDDKNLAIERYDHFMNCFLYGFCEIHDNSIHLKKRNLASAYMFQMRSDFNRKILKKIRQEYFKSDQKLKIVDIGGGISGYTDVLDKDTVVVFDLFRGYDWDITAGMESRKRRRNNISYVVSDAPNLPINDKNADIVLCLEVFEHLPDDSVRFNVLTEIFRLMNKNSIFLFSTPNIGDLIGRYKKLVKDSGFEHHGVWDWKMMETSLKKNFDIINTFGTPLDIQFLNPLLRKIPLLLIPLHLANIALGHIPGGKKTKHQLIIISSL